MRESVRLLKENLSGAQRRKDAPRAEKGVRTPYHLVKRFFEAWVRFRAALKCDKLRLSWPSWLVVDGESRIIAFRKELRSLSQKRCGYDAADARE